jgi:hypothetical protein
MRWKREIEECCKFVAVLAMAYLGMLAVLMQAS